MSKALSRISRRRALEGAAAGFVALGLLLWWLLPLGEEPPSGTITFSTGTRAGVYQEYGELLRNELAKDMPQLKVRLLTSDGSQENVERVATGQADFTIAAADAVDTFKIDDKPVTDRLRSVARLYDDYVQLVVPPDSDIRSVADLKGKRVAIGLPDSGVRLIATRVLEAAGIDPEKDITPRSDGIDTGPKRLGHELDAFFWSSGVPTDGLEKIAETSGFRFVPIGAALVAKVHTQGDAAHFYRATNMPESAYPTVQNGDTVPTIAVSNLLITRKDMDPRLTEWVTRTVIKSRDGIGAHVHSAQLVDLRTAIYTDPLALHDGARNYYRSVKP
ncbi:MULTISPECIES: TAXI family TRAP transporter solute-binding subunit [unclassified Streptomyces]|uniref:TAXI family TRAP transporter solute-binding subunit n=1 Tax=unclassified Streptomyces TaxID=2593676 RepID=UPI00236623CF|nr:MULTISPECIES: TAXI family TRAP transporter solute-binding subunit [unclassified Streptomyces]MDF3143375.1 TAXI family TRAP transporter solute-binding subunit [Streptomyces sp. T21Q-yed]WDF41795.1 TAXI family TRAP transporter solute-binding subunit [Streptomyces sp. T12]